MASFHQFYSATNCLISLIFYFSRLIMKFTAFMQVMTEQCLPDFLLDLGAFYSDSLFILPLCCHQVIDNYNVFHHVRRFQDALYSMNSLSLIHRIYVIKLIFPYSLDHDNLALFRLISVLVLTLFIIIIIKADHSSVIFTLHYCVYCNSSQNDIVPFPNHLYIKFLFLPLSVVFLFVTRQSR